MKHLLIILSTVVLASCGVRSISKTITGNDRDEHGCVASAGYVWSQARKDCVRLFEVGIRVDPVTSDSGYSAFIVFSPDSLNAEVFIPGVKRGELLDRRKRPSGGYAWNVEDDDTKNVIKINDKWVIEQRGSKIYEED